MNDSEYSFNAMKLLENPLVTDLSRFSLYGITTYGKVLEVHDGDTFDMALVLPTHVLCQERKLSKRKKGVCLISNTTEPMIMRYKCRLSGIDARELSDTHGGDFAKQVLASYIAHQTVKCDIDQYDKYGRPLVSIYNQYENVPKKYMMLNEYLISDEDFNGHKLSSYFTFYDGGTKKKFVDTVSNN